jgi:hypothetical protein
MEEADIEKRISDKSSHTAFTRYHERKLKLKFNPSTEQMEINPMLKI